MGSNPETDRAGSLKNSTHKLELRHGGVKKALAAMDVKQTVGETVAFVDLPGVEEDEIQISEAKGVVTISAAREFNHDAEDAEEYTILGRSYGTFSCSFELPTTADANSMTAKYNRGVLKVRIPNKRT